MKKDKELNLLKIKKDLQTYTSDEFKISTTGSDSLELKFDYYGKESNINYDFLHKLSKHFGTLNININNYVTDSGGCETCGPNYDTEVTIQIKGITKNI